ncbi:MAG: hypothetical protein ACI9FD_001532 [Gammaproteobacteria bacterium]|jgi:hypothetical protein
MKSKFRQMLHFNRNLVRVFAAVFGLFALCPTVIQAQADEPDTLITNAVEALKSNDLATLVRSSLGDAEFQQLGEQWDTSRQQRLGEISEQDRAEFAGFMGLLLAPGSEEMILSMIEPKLAELQTGLMQFVALFQGMGAMQIQQLTDVDAEAKQNLTAALNASAQWITTNDLANTDKARQAIQIVVEKARALEIKSLDDIANLSYQNMLNKAGEVLALARDVLTNYGISVDALLDSIEVETLSNDGSKANVVTRFEFLGTPQSIESTLINQDGRWVSEDALRQAQMISLLNQMPSSSSAVSGSAEVSSVSASLTAQSADDSDPANRLQKSLLENPFLQRWQIDLEVIGVSNGFATLRLRGAPAGLQDAVKQGQDLTQMDVQNLPIAEDRMAVNALRNVLETLANRGEFDSAMILPADN